MNFRTTFLVLFLVAARVHGETNEVRQIPPPGIAIAASDRAELERGAAELKKEIESLRTSSKRNRR